MNEFHFGNRRVHSPSLTSRPLQFPLSSYLRSMLSFTFHLLGLLAVLSKILLPSSENSSVEFSFQYTKTDGTQFFIMTLDSLFIDWQSQRLMMIGESFWVNNSSISTISSVFATILLFSETLKCECVAWAASCTHIGIHNRDCKNNIHAKN